VEDFLWKDEHFTDEYTHGHVRKCQHTVSTALRHPSQRQDIAEQFDIGELLYQVIIGQIWIWIRFSAIFVNNMIVILQISHFPEGTWLVFSNVTTSLKEFLTDTHIPFDCEFLVAKSSAGEADAEISLTEVYHVHPTLPLRECRVANWSYASGIVWFNTPSTQRRRNLQGITIRVAIRKQVISIVTTMYEIVTVALYGCETWSLTLREEHKLKVFKIGCWEHLDE
jgi:hypothetical protein